MEASSEKTLISEVDTLQKNVTAKLLSLEERLASIKKKEEEIDLNTVAEAPRTPQRGTRGSRFTLDSSKMDVRALEKKIVLDEENKSVAAKIASLKEKLPKITQLRSKVESSSPAQQEELLKEFSELEQSVTSLTGKNIQDKVKQFENINSVTKSEIESAKDKRRSLSRGSSPVRTRIADTKGGFFSSSARFSQSPRGSEILLPEKTDPTPQEGVVILNRTRVSSEKTSVPTPAANREQEKAAIVPRTSTPITLSRSNPPKQESSNVLSGSPDAINSVISSSAPKRPLMSKPVAMTTPTPPTTPTPTPTPTPTSFKSNPTPPLMFNMPNPSGISPRISSPRVASPKVPHSAVLASPRTSAAPLVSPRQNLAPLSPRSRQADQKFQKTETLPTLASPKPPAVATSSTKSAATTKILSSVARSLAETQGHPTKAIPKVLNRSFSTDHHNVHATPPSSGSDQSENSSPEGSGPGSPIISRNTNDSFDEDSDDDSDEVEAIEKQATTKKVHELQLQVKEKELERRIQEVVAKEDNIKRQLAAAEKERKKVEDKEKDLKSRAGTIDVSQNVYDEKMKQLVDKEKELDTKLKGKVLSTQDLQLLEELRQEEKVVKQLSVQLEEEKRRFEKEKQELKKTEEHVKEEEKSLKELEERTEEIVRRCNEKAEENQKLLAEGSKFREEIELLQRYIKIMEEENLTIRNLVEQKQQKKEQKKEEHNQIIQSMVQEIYLLKKQISKVKRAISRAQRSSGLKITGVSHGGHHLLHHAHAQSMPTLPAFSDKDKLAKVTEQEVKSEPNKNPNVEDDDDEEINIDDLDLDGIDDDDDEEIDLADVLGEDIKHEKKTEAIVQTDPVQQTAETSTETVTKTEEEPKTEQAPTTTQ
eukprot:TRINITY_DN77_c0_g2_i1.p1 TRINITY_DN77_c0_g2~~TRINITY_DN77_c0_g2_i1.p1  ORF type:complete len:877 (-),score=329.66 TRINITY_DN77_c0_g2_i1:83-2713(-)